MMSSGVSLARWWAPLAAAALTFSLFHTLVDWHIGLFGGTSQDLSPQQAALAWVTAALYGWWGWSLASAAAQRSYVASVVVLTIGWALAGNGLVISRVRRRVLEGSRTRTSRTSGVWCREHGIRTHLRRLPRRCAGDDR